MALTEKLTAIADAIRVQSGKTDKLTLDQMPSEIASLQNLNFNVVGNPQPSNPTENTIWIDTDTPITSWIFSATEPEMVEGKVWITTGTASTVAFNALKENSVMVYPLSAKQYVSGALVDKEAESYQGGKWVSFVPSLVLVPYTGTDRVWTKAMHGNYGRSSATNNADGTKTLWASTSSNGTYFNTSTYQTPVNLTDYSVLKYRASVSTSGTVGNNAARVGVGLKAEWGYTGTAFATLNLSGETTGEIDISALTGEHPVGIQAQSNNTGNSVTSTTVNLLVLELN